MKCDPIHKKTVAYGGLSELSVAELTDLYCNFHGLEFYGKWLNYVVMGYVWSIH